MRRARARWQRRCAASAELHRDVERDLAAAQLERLALAVAPDRQVREAARPGRSDQPRQLVRLVDLLAVPLEHHVADAYVALVAGSALLDVDDERAGGFIELERARELLGHRLDRDADAPARHLALALELTRDVE